MSLLGEVRGQQSWSWPLEGGDTWWDLGVAGKGAVPKYDQQRARGCCRIGSSPSRSGKESGKEGQSPHLTPRQGTQRRGLRGGPLIGLPRGWI